MNAPLVSVIVPTYNRRETLGGCISSILRQTYRPVELIVVDDGSTDGTEEFIRTTYGKDVLYIPQPHSGIPARVRNVGLDRATGEYLAFCDSDDVWFEEKLRTQMERLQGSDFNCSCSDARINGSHHGTVLSQYAFTKPDMLTQLLWDNFIITSSVVLHRSTLGPSRFPATPGLVGYEDYWLWLTLAENLRIDFIVEPLLHYSHGPGRLSDRVRSGDTVSQLRIILTHPVYRKYPMIMLKKILRHGRRLIA